MWPDVRNSFVEQVLPVSQATPKTLGVTGVVTGSMETARSFIAEVRTAFKSPC